MKQTTFAALLPNRVMSMPLATRVVSAMMEPPISISRLMCVRAVGPK